jgi:hypothetical protein
MAKIKGQLEEAQLHNKSADPTPGKAGLVFYNYTDSKARIDTGAAIQELTTNTATQTLTGKTLVVASNTITTAASGNLAATELNTALAELQTDIDSRATATGLSDHLADGTAAHAASAVSFAPAGTIAATDAQTAIAEVATDAASALSTHEADTSTHGVATVAGLSETQTFSNKTFSDAPILAEIATPSTPASGYVKLYAKSDNKLYQLNDAGTESQVGSGSGGGAINYISANSDAETNTDGYSTYADAAGSTPVDGTGGAANITFTRSTSNPLRGTASFLITKDAANRQGEGVSYAITLSDADKCKPLTITFDYEIASGTYATGDLTCYIYDVTNAAVIQPTGYSIQNVGIESRHIAEFQATTSTSYRLCFHVASTSASAYAVKLDNLCLGPNAVARGAAITDWVAYTPTFTSFGTVSTNGCFWRRVGSNVELLCRWSNGTTTGSEARVSLPSGLTVSTTELASLKVVGNAWRNVAGAYYAYYVNCEAGNSYVTFGASAAATQTPILKLNGTNFANSEAVGFHCSIPIQGWSSSVLMSTDTDTRECSAIYKMTSNQTLTTGQLNYDTAIKDTHGAVTTGAGAWKFTAPLPGRYQVSIVNLVTVAVADSLVVYKNGSAFSGIGTTNTTNTTGGTAVLDLLAGDYIDIRSNTGGSTTHSGSTNSGRFVQIAITRIAGPAQVMASESVNARYSTTAGQSIANNTVSIIDFGTKTFDSHSSVTTGAAWKFTASSAGKHRVSAQAILAAAVGLTAGEETSLALYKNGSLYSYLYFTSNWSGTSVQQSLTGSDSISLVAGDYIDIRINQVSGASISLNTTAALNWVSIERTGN